MSRTILSAKMGVISILAMALVLQSVKISMISVSAKETKETLQGKYYVFDSDNKYEMNEY